MKTLKNHVILFDGECPMCCVYTSAFVKTGMLSANGRAAYQDSMDTFCPLVDKQRAVNEIALVNLENGEVTYGVKSLLKVIGNTCPIVIPIFACKAFEWVMSKIYAFISYNRRVIIPAGRAGDGFAWQPSFKIRYRLAYLLFTWFCTGYILTAYAHLLAPVVPLGSPGREYLICGGQIIFQGLVISMFKGKQLWAYLGNVMTISFAGSLLLSPVMLLNHFFKLPALMFPVYFLVVAGLMFLEHVRRTKLLGMGWTLTITWAIYRLALLTVILYK